LTSLFGSYPSASRTFTGRLTSAMLEAVLADAADATRRR